MQVINVWCGCLAIWIWCECYFFWYEFDMNLMVKKYDFDRVVLFANLVWLKSIDFTGDLNDWWDVNRWFLMCYFIIKYSVFGGVRENALFIRVWGDFRVKYWWFLMVLKVMKCLILVGFVEVGIELKMGVEVWEHQICRSWLPAVCSKM